MIEHAVRRVADGILSVVIAPACAACGAILESPTAGPVCGVCWQAVTPLRPPLCDRCGDPLPSWRVIDAAHGVCARCRRAAGTIDRARAAGEYEGRLREIIHALKYSGHVSLSTRLGALMRAAGGDVLEGTSCAVPVPLHPWRRIRRGFNQATALAGQLGLPVVHAVWRARVTSPQAGLTAIERRRNVRDVFILSPWMRRERARRRWLEGRCVLLVDDVRTTGATLEACARVLREAGVAEVRALTLARAAPPLPR